MVLSVPKNMKLLAIPLFELYDNSVRSVSEYFRVLWDQSLMVIIVRIGTGLN
jgi:hypothetical protein